MIVLHEANPFGVDNHPFWNPDAPQQGQGHQEVWYLKLNDTEAGCALWLRFTLLVRADGTKRAAETWGIFFERHGKELLKIGLKNTHDLEGFRKGEQSGFRIDACSFSDRHTAGEVRNGAHVIRWDLDMAEAHRCAFDFVPAVLRRMGVVKNIAVNVFEDLRYSGWSEVDGRRHTWNNAPGMQGHLAGSKNGHSWAWAHCNAFQDRQGQPAPVIFDGLSARARLRSGRATPLLSTLYFWFNGKDYCINRVRDIIRCRSKYAPGSWVFHAGRDGALFRGEVFSALDDFAGVTYEDTDGSALYCYNSKVSSMNLDVTAPGKPTERYEARGNVAFEFVTREPHPGIPLLI